MTARQELRVASRRPTNEEWSIESQRAPTVGEVLLTARARKGVDLARAERETKIRARHLMALENGDYADLPAPVYTKGFLRNYAQYLGLDPDEMLARWRRELDVPRSADRPSVVAPPQPIAAPRRGLKVTPGLLVALLLAVVVLGFAGYVGLQLVRFSQNPEIVLAGPSVRWLAPGSSVVILTGTGTARASVTVTGADDLVRTTEADSSGAWSLEVPVAKGRNDFTLVGTDPETGRSTATVNVIATVPVGAAASRTGTTDVTADTGPVAAPEAPATTEVLLVAPFDGTVARQGRLKIEGTSDAAAVIASLEWLGKPRLAPRHVEPLRLPVTDGIFRGTMPVPAGRWTVSVRSEVPATETPALASRRFRSTYNSLVVDVDLADSSRLTVIADGERVEDGARLPPGQRTYRAEGSLLVKAGNAKAVEIIVDGVPYGPMGQKAKVVSWIIEPGREPQPEG